MLISIIYILTFYSQGQGLDFIAKPNFAASLVLIWLVILMSWYIVTIITKQKMELLDVHDRLLRADNLARVGELAAGVAHEINNPIGIIAATAEYLKMCTEPGDDRLEEIDAIYKEAMRCKDIVQQMLTYANPRPAGLAPIEPRSINDEVLHFVFPKNRAGETEDVREYVDDPPIFQADPNLLKQALMNLYINAKQSIPEGQPGRIVARVLESGPRPQVVSRSKITATVSRRRTSTISSSRSLRARRMGRGWAWRSRSRSWRSQRHDLRALQKGTGFDLQHQLPG